MEEHEIIATLALLNTEGVGDIMAKKLLHHFGTAQLVHKAKANQLAAIDGVGPVLIKNLKNSAPFHAAESEYRFLKDHHSQILYYKDSSYPNRLKHCIDGPVLLFASGNINFNNPKIISIVGTREVTPYGAEFCKKLIDDLAPLHPIIVSGFAYGVDIVAHKAAMEQQLQTIAVIAHGLDQIYPKSHSKYVSKMKENGGFITEFWTNTNPEKENFVRRNRIVAGISEATIVIESAEKGGSLITANMALDYNRDVFALPGRSSDKYSQGCNNLIKTQKANLFTSAADLIYMLNWSIDPIDTQLGIQKQLFVSLDPNEQCIYDFLLSKGKEELDNIALECQLPVFKTAAILIQLELKGLVRPLVGKTFEVI